MARDLQTQHANLAWLSEQWQLWKSPAPFSGRSSLAMQIYKESRKKILMLTGILTVAYKFLRVEATSDSRVSWSLEASGSASVELAAASAGCPSALALAAKSCIGTNRKIRKPYKFYVSNLCEQHIGTMALWFLACLSSQKHLSTLHGLVFGPFVRSSPHTHTHTSAPLSSWNGCLCTVKRFPTSMSP